MLALCSYRLRVTLSGRWSLVVLALVWCLGAALHAAQLSSLYSALAYVTLAAYAIRSDGLVVGKSSPSQVLLGVLPHVLVFALLGPVSLAIIVLVSPYRIVSAALSAAVEEAFFRGVMTRELERFSPRLAGYATSAAFAFFNMPPSHTLGAASLLPSYFLLGEALRACYAKRGWAGAFLMHFTYNVAGYMYVVINEPHSVLVVTFSHVLLYVVARTLFSDPPQGSINTPNTVNA